MEATNAKPTWKKVATAAMVVGWIAVVFAWYSGRLTARNSTDRKTVYEVKIDAGTAIAEEVAKRMTVSKTVEPAVAYDKEGNKLQDIPANTRVAYDPGSGPVNQGPEIMLRAAIENPATRDFVNAEVVYIPARKLEKGTAAVQSSPPATATLASLNTAPDPTGPQFVLRVVNNSSDTVDLTCKTESDVTVSWTGESFVPPGKNRKYPFNQTVRCRIVGSVTDQETQLLSNDTTIELHN